PAPESAMRLRMSHVNMADRAKSQLIGRILCIKECPASCAADRFNADLSRSHLVDRHKPDNSGELIWVLKRQFARVCVKNTSRFPAGRRARNIGGSSFSIIWFCLAVSHSSCWRPAFFFPRKVADLERSR